MGWLVGFNSYRFVVFICVGAGQSDRRPFLIRTTDLCGPEDRHGLTEVDPYRPQKTRIDRKASYKLVMTAPRPDS